MPGCGHPDVKVIQQDYPVKELEWPMGKIQLDPACADTAPTDAMLTPYDHEHAITYLRLLDADAEGADWREVAEIVLQIDPARERDERGGRTRAIWRERAG